MKAVQNYIETMGVRNLSNNPRFKIRFYWAIPQSTLEIKYQNGVDQSQNLFIPYVIVIKSYP